MDDVSRSIQARVDDLLDQGKHEKAIATAREAIQQEPTNPVYYGVLAFAYNNNGELQRALDAAKQGIEIDSFCANALRQCGWAYLGLEKYVEALELYTRALDVEPDIRWVLLDRASCYRLLGRYEDALPDLARAYELEPKDAYRSGDPKGDKRLREWFETIHQHFSNELSPRVNSSANERFIEYWPCHLVWDAQVETRWFSGSSKTFYCGSAGTGYLCLSTANAYLVALGRLTTRYKPTKDEGLAAVAGLFSTVKWDVDLQKSDELRVAPARGIRNAQVVGRALPGWVDVESQSGRYLIWPVFRGQDVYISRALAWAGAGYPGLHTPPRDQLAESGPETHAVTLLRQLGELRAAGILTEEEFEAKKKVLLDRL